MGGAYKSGLLGENPKELSNDLFPYVAKVTIGKRKSLGVCSVMIMIRLTAETFRITYMWYIFARGYAKAVQNIG